VQMLDGGMWDVRRCVSRLLATTLRDNNRNNNKNSILFTCLEENTAEQKKNPKEIKKQ